MTSTPSGCLDCTRRQFLALGSLAAVSSFLAACGSDSSEPTGLGQVNVTVRPGDYLALAVVGGIARVQGISAPVALVRATESSYRAFSMICPHQGTVIAISGSGFRCPNHGATF
ncbi:MAG: Rieske 2Fe-2S domain-containing protein, partial [Gemmatimonadaceae bacterium]